MFVYKELYSKIIQSRVLESRGFEDILIRCSTLTKTAPPEFQIFAVTLLHYSLMFLNNVEAVTYDQFKLIIHDFLQISFERYNTTDTECIIIASQMNIISCILARVFYEYLVHVKCKKEQINSEFD